jgi:Raf kinase inhibitor-like YbhB/YbcL family protein
MALMLKSSAFNEGGRIPNRFTADGENISPPLAWSDPPPSTQSFALVCSDPDAPRGTWYHWAVYDLPASASQLAEDQPREAIAGEARQAITDFDQPGWGGPCPPKGSAAHRYRFHLMALNIPSLELPEHATCADVERAAADHVIGESVLTATYSR